jgi:periplasmic divalent cation tolerance protein
MEWLRKLHGTIVGLDSRPRKLALEAPMPAPTPPARIVLTTTANPEEAARLGRTLVEERLVACATLISSVQSIYRWQGAVESAAETLLLLKTSPDQLAALEARLHELHSYQTPEFLVLKVDAASQPYLDWLTASLGQP